MKMVILLWSCMFFSCVLIAQDMKERYRKADEFQKKYGAGYFYGDVLPQWIPDTHYFWYRVKTQEGIRFILIDAEKKSKTLAFSTDLVTERLSVEVGRTIRPEDLPYKELVFTKDLREVRIPLGKVVYVYDRKRGKIVGKEQVEEPVRWGYWGNIDWEKRSEATFSPDGKKEAFIREGNVFVKDSETGKIRQLSVDGSPGEYYSSRISWSPDSKKFVSCKWRPVWVRKLHLTVSSPDDRLQPRSEEYDYLKPGDAVPLKNPVLFVPEEGKQVDIEFPEPEKQYSVGNICWDAESKYFTFDYNKRGHQEFIVYKVNVDSPEAEALVTEKMSTFVHYDRLYRYTLEKSRELLWISERDGWRHLYLYDITQNKVKQQLTDGEWVVRRILHVDEEKRLVYLVGLGKDTGEDPYLAKVYCLHIDNGELNCLTPENGNHEVVFSSDYQFFTDSWSRVDNPPVTALKRTEGGEMLMILEKADISKMLADGWQMPEVFAAKGRDGETDIWGVIIRPVDFDPERKYPVIEYIYAGPHNSFVPKSFAVSPLYYGCELAQLGFIVVQIDGMGTANRSKKFHDVCWKNLKDSGFPDRIAWLKAAAAKHPEMDIERMGICGFSAGGQSTMGALLFYPDFYKAGVASCGCYDNRMDKIWWNEQWMGYPVDDSYKASAVTEHAHLLKGNLMLILGELDNNVDPSSSLQLVNALIKSGKEFEFVVLPNVRHTMGEGYADRKRRDFFVRNLLKLETQDWNRMQK